MTIAQTVYSYLKSMKAVMKDGYTITIDGDIVESVDLRTREVNIGDNCRICYGKACYESAEEVHEAFSKANGVRVMKEIDLALGEFLGTSKNG